MLQNRPLDQISNFVIRLGSISFRNRVENRTDNKATYLREDDHLVEIIFSETFVIGLISARTHR